MHAGLLCVFGFGGHQPETWTKGWPFAQAPRVFLLEVEQSGVLKMY